MNVETAEMTYKLDVMLPYSVHVKTQYGGEDLHIALVSLLKYLEQKYFVAADTRVYDEGDYWNTLDKETLNKHFERYQTLINSVSVALENANWKPTNDPNEIATQLEEILRKKFDE